MFYFDYLWQGQDYHTLLMQRLEWIIYDIRDLKVLFRRYILFTLAGCNFSEVSEYIVSVLNRLYLEMYVILLSINREDLLPFYQSQMEWPVSDFL